MCPSPGKPNDYEYCTEASYRQRGRAAQSHLARWALQRKPRPAQLKLVESSSRALTRVQPRWPARRLSPTRR